MSDVVMYQADLDATGRVGMLLPDEAWARNNFPGRPIRAVRANAERAPELAKGRARECRHQGRRTLMGWSIGYDDRYHRFIGYGVPAYCDHPRCTAEIDRGLSYVCGNEPYGGEHGCGLFFCANHLAYYTSNRHQACSRCGHYKPPFDPKPDHPTWVRHMLRDHSWKQWRDEHPKEVAAMRERARTFHRAEKEIA